MPRGRATGTLQGSGVSVVGLTGGAGSNRLTERGDESTQLMPAGGCGGTNKVLPRPQRDGSRGKRVRKNAPGGVVFHASEQGSSQGVWTKKMKRLGVSVVLIGTLILSVLPGANAAVAPGSKCSKAGVKQTYKGKVYTCIKLGNNLVWNKLCLMFR